MVTDTMKEYKITVRLNEVEYNNLISMAEKSNISKSQYMRQALQEKVYGENTNYIEALCHLSTVCTKILDKCELEAEEREELVKGVEYAWEQLS